MSAAAPFGFINAFKPPGPSSASFGNWVRHALSAAAVGHWGTLDPAACGVLVLAVGKATKLLPLLPHARKSYVFELVAGERTDSGDAHGAVIEKVPVGEHWGDGLDAAAASLTGSLTQIPPMYSAVKVDGQPLYRLARKGRDLPRAPRPTEIFNLRVIAQGASTARLFIECEAGTYVRVVCEDLGRYLGLPARMGALLRVASGPFVLRDCVRPATIASDPRGSLIDPLAVLSNQRVELDERDAQRFAHGNEVRLAPHSAATDLEATDLQVRSHPAPEVLVTHCGELVGCGFLFARDGTDLLAPSRVFAELSQSNFTRPGR
ncbi:MAG TPA: tRNA pseudouridine(55) synthase TruB [Candidatus Eremiobacteraceae bacterium]|nr:tRNA pseudouridine(55) synthase TruB [Candidatus Eremiobacteraceae bacterium]